MTIPAPSLATLSPRARFIVRGLVATGRSKRTHGQQPERGHLQLFRRAGGSYWLAIDGSSLLAGETLADAEPLQVPFVDLMARVGTP